MKESKKLTPLEAIDSCISSMFFLDGFQNHGGGHIERRWRQLRPGALIERMPESVREDLRRLKSHHFSSMPMDKWRYQDNTWERKKRASDELMEFDKKILKR